MAQFVEVPLRRLDAAVLSAMLEEFATRDGTDYGLRELALEEKVDNLMRQLTCGNQWDLCTRDRRRELGL